MLIASVQNVCTHKQMLAEVWMDTSGHSKCEWDKHTQPHTRSLARIQTSRTSVGYLSHTQIFLSALYEV